MTAKEAFEAQEILKEFCKGLDSLSESKLIGALDLAIKALGKDTNVPSNDTISRQAAIDAVCSVCGNDCDKTEFLYDAPQWDQVIMCPEHYVLTTLPSELPERDKGEWIQKRLDYDNDVWIRWECSRCGYSREKDWKYILEAKKPEALFCEMCGADMR